MSRHDNVGFFWEDEVRESKKGVRQEINRPLAPIPDTGWRAPTEFPSLRGAKRIAIDLETYDPDLLERGPGVRRDGYIVGVAVGTDDRFRAYYPMRHTVGAEHNIAPESVLAWLREELGRESQPKVGANILYDLDYLQHAGVTVRGRLLDVQIAEPLIDENLPSYSLESLARRYLNESKVDEDLYRWAAASYGGDATRRAQAGNIWRCPPQLVGPYAEGDVDLPLRILAKQEEEIARQDLTGVFDLETRLLPLLLAMRVRGVRVDLAAAERAHEALTRRIAALTRDLGGIDVYSRSDLEHYCKKEKIAYPKTEAGNASFTAAFLESSDDPRLRKVVEVRKLTKCRDVFIAGYILDKHVGGRIHCQFHPLRGEDGGAVSGRFSSSDPNLQNIPNRDPELGPLVRSMFIPDSDDHEWVRYDQSQIEFRFLTHYGRGRGAEEVRQQFRTDPTVDFHTMTAELCGIDRKPAKSINFGLVYGMGEKTMAENLGRPLEEVKPLFEKYHARLPFVRETYEAVSRAAQQRGWIRTVLGRKRRFTLWEDKRWGENKTYYPSLEAAEAALGRGRARRAQTNKALNALLQGSAADQIKKAMVDIWESGLCAEDMLGPPCITVHDELDWSMPKGRVKEQQEIRRMMQEAVPLRVPVITDWGTGRNWSEAG